MTALGYLFLFCFVVGYIVVGALLAVAVAPKQWWHALLIVVVGPPLFAMAMIAGKP